MSTPEATPTDELDAAVATLIEIGGHLSQMVAHMNAAPTRRTPDGQVVVPIPSMLGALLVDTLRPVADARTPDMLAALAVFLGTSSSACPTRSSSSRTRSTGGVGSKPPSRRRNV